MPYLGEIAGIGTAILWAANAIFFAEGAKRIDALSVSILRLILASIILVATVAVALATIVIGKARKVVASTKNAKAMLFVALGTTIGLIMGTLLAFVSINNTEVGVGATLISLSPLILLPASRIIYGERITLIAIVGTIVTLAGVALLMLR
ncbi:MAG: hypothetical protein E3J71_01070 [Candidatus Stahlbacteria bacterium]|nr:MAG: hypothetical protein E3J71_01070 [Candidatus Stahlbacteria bacterium]